ncbi:MAG: septal ring lytic transglycosylase RlpA family protein [Patescibacteria group bacterium]
MSFPAPANSEKKADEGEKIKQRVIKYQETVVSWYGEEFEGKLTANGEIFRAAKISAAHRSLPFGSLVLFVNPKSQESLVVRINDRGPFVRGRDYDLSKGAATRLGVRDRGIATVLSRCITIPSP